MALSNLANLDRRWIFLALLIAVSIPILTGSTFPEEPNLLSQGMFDYIENLPDGSLVALALDYDQSPSPELAPMTTAIVRHCCLKRHRMVFVTLWPTGTPMIADAVRDIVEGEFADAKLQYGVDYVNLGFHTGEIVAIRLLMSNIRTSRPTDVNGTPLDNLPLTRTLKGLREVDLIVNITGGYPGGKEWVQFASTQYQTKLAVGCVGVQGPLLMPYFPRQLQGLLLAVKGGAEYEVALKRRYPEFFQGDTVRLNEGLRRMGPQLWAHLLIIGLIALGNLAAWLQPRPTPPAARSAP